MGKVAVKLQLEKLKQLLLQHAHLITEAMNLMERLETSFRLFKDLDFDEQWRENQEVRDLIRRIRYTVYDAEDIIDSCIVLANDVGEHQAPTEFVGIVEEVEAVVDKFQQICGHEIAIKNEFAPRIEAGAQTPYQSEGSKVKETSMVGLEDEIDKLKRLIFEETPELDVIPILGLAGLGKTTMAYRIFHDPQIQYEFPTRIWVYVSKEFIKKEIYLAILEGFTMLTDDIKSKTDDALADLVVRHLENERFLLVLDDLWTPEDWYKVQVALPKSNKKGKVLITTRFEEVSLCATRRKEPYEMRFLTTDESSELLYLEIARNIDKFPRKLEYLLYRIAIRSDGHPLTVVLIGGILVKEISNNVEEMEKWWLNVYENLTTHLRTQDRVKRLEQIIALCYEKIPYHLRECFLSFGVFPEDFEIPVWKLIRLWIAEGLIPQKNGVSLEETAEKYLEELITRKLVKAEKFKLDGRVKTCRIHDMLRDFCIAEAQKEGLFQEITSSDDGFFPPISTESKFRRLCIHSNIFNFVSLKPYHPKVRSFFHSSRNEITLPMEHISAIPKGFKLLRVLDVEPIKFVDKLPRDLFHLYHLKFLVLSVNFQVLPSGFSKLWNIETLVVNTSSRTLEIRADLLNMTRLMHFKTNASAALPNTSENGAGTEIHTLGNIAPESCTRPVFDRVRNVKKLGVRGNLVLLLDDKNQSMDSFGNLSNLEKLKLLHDVYPVPPSGAQLRGLPPASKFPRNLKILTLSRTSLDWCHMSILGSLESLVVLKVKDKAFVGDKWEVIDGGFNHLEVLHIERTNLKIWLVDDLHFPKLRHLQLKHCDHLEEVPIELADAQTFMKLDLFHCKHAAASALEIKAAKKVLYGTQFELSIFPWRDAHASF